MALVGTFLGGVAAIPAALLSAENIVKNQFIRGLVRLLMNLIRSLPEMLLAALFVAVVGIGALSGVLALAIFSFGMIFKLLYEAIETIDEGPIEALRAAGANSIQIICFAVVPQVFNQYLSFFLYTLEINVRASTVLGYLGAGGIGLYLNTTLEMFRYDRTAVVILAILLVVVLVDFVSNQLREVLKWWYSKRLYGKKANRGSSPLWWPPSLFGALLVCRWRVLSQRLGRFLARFLMAWCTRTGPTYTVGMAKI